MGLSAGARHIQRTEYLHARDLPTADQPTDAAVSGEDLRLPIRQKVFSALDEQWVLAFRRRGPDDRFTIVHPPADRFYADLFLAEHDGRTLVFFEDYSHVERKGTIACAELRAGGIGEPHTVLAGPDHLSYPSLFQWRGDWFMVPENGARRRVEIWRARRFPGEWTLDTIALDGVDACDATLWQHDGRWWMFVTLCVAGGPRADEVSLFDAAHRPGHGVRIAPIRSCPMPHTRGRRARLPRRRGAHSPVTGCTRRIRHAVTLNRIDRLTPRDIGETPFGSITPTWHPRVRGTQTIARSSTFEVIDPSSSLPSPLTEQRGRSTKSALGAL